MTSPSIALVVHGHFYQPPRENPWIDQLQREPSAAPAHDWNARIHAECYRANGFARIHGAAGHIQSIVNNYQRLSFNFGPTLGRWIEQVDPDTQARLQAADADQRKRLGHGGAMAQAYAHPIVPLLNAVDRRTHLIWGLSDFRRRFGREAEGLWLPETGVDPATLEALIDLGVRFTILAPEQIAAVRAIGSEKWTTVDRQTLDTGRAYRWLHRDGSGRFIDLAVFDGPLSRAVAFGDALGRAETFLDNVKTSAERSKVSGQRLVLCASDGELFGHHKKFADLTLAFANFVEARRRGIDVTNIPAYLESHPTTWEVKLSVGPGGEGTAWSCPHGLGRWQRDCGCNMGGLPPGWNQAWRGPLRAALDCIRDAAAELYEDAGAPLLIDPWGARDAYGDVVDAPLAARDQLLASFGTPALQQDRDGARQRARLLMEMQRATLLMYASCGWFFDDVAGLEASLIVRLGAHAVDLYGEIAGAAAGRTLADRAQEILAGAISNRPEEGTGADVYRRMAGQRVTAKNAIAHAGLARLIGDESLVPEEIGFAVSLLDQRPGGMPEAPALTGRARATHQRTGITEEAGFVASWHRGAAFQCRVGGEIFTLATLGPDEREGLLRAAMPRLLKDAAGDVRLMRQIMDEVRGLTAEDEGDSVRRHFYLTMLDQVLRLPLAALTPAALALAADLYEAAALPADAPQRRLLEEQVWRLIEAGLRSDDLTRLSRQLGFAVEAVGAKSVGA